MPASKGKNITITWNAVQLLGVREKTFTVNGETINVTSDEDNGKQLLLADTAEDSIEISVSGVTKSPVLRNDAMAKTTQRTLVYTWPDGASLTGTFMLSGYSEGKPYNEAYTYEATFMSSGAWVYVPGS